MRSGRKRRLNLGVGHLALALVLVLMLTGSAVAAGHYLITSVDQISPNVLKALAGKRGPTGRTGARGRNGATGLPGESGAPGPAGAAGTPGINGTDGTDGTNGQGPAFQATNAAGFTLSSDTDTSFHTIATLQVPTVGAYTVTATVEVQTSGGSDEGDSECVLFGDSGSDPQTEGQAEASIDSSTANTTMALQTIHTFSVAGTVELRCRQLTQLSGGAMFSWGQANIIATQVTSVTSTAVTS
jgi:hypothetical protein